MTVAELAGFSWYWPEGLRDTAWHGPEAYLVGDWEVCLIELGQRAATHATEEWEFHTTQEILIEALGGHVHQPVLMCEVCWKRAT